MSSSKWKSWCRLCAQIDGIELKLETIQNVWDILQKFFGISISSSEDCLSVICQECINLVLKVEKFALRCVKANQMFLELAKDNISEDSVESVRQKFGLFDRNEYGNCETKHLEERSDLCCTPADHDVEIVSVTKAAPIVINVRRVRRVRRSCRVKEEKPLSENEFEEAESDYGDVDDNEDDDALYTPERIKLRAELDVDRQSETKKLQLFAKIRTTRTTVKKRKKSIESKPKSIKRKPIKGTDVWCHLCDTTFDLPRLYMRHMRDKHRPDVLPFVCAHCPKVFVSEQKMLQHAVSHRPVEQKKTHPCPECGKTFSKAENVQLHIRIVHMGERPFVCEECGKACSTKGALKEHQVTHSEERPFKCNDCPKSFKDLPALKRHTETHNTAATFECIQCGQRLNTRQTLKIHMLVHSDEKRYKCHHCGNAYKRYPALKDHLILHTGMRPYACPFCFVTYANGSNLRNHKKKCHPVELAAMEAAGQVTRPPSIPNAKYLQPQ